MYDTLDMRKILEQKEKKSGYEPQGAWGMWIVRNYDRLQKRVEQIRKTGEGTYAFYPGSWYKLHSTLYGKLWKKLILQTAVLMILSMLYLMDYERIYKTQDLVLATTTGKKMMEKKMLAGTLCGLFYAGLLTVFTLMVSFAAVTSSVSVMEAIVSSMMDKFHVSRKKGTILTTLYGMIVGVIVCLGYNKLYFDLKLPNRTVAQILDVMDYISNNCLMPMVALLTCILIGWVVKPKVIIDEVTLGGYRFGREKLYVAMIKVIAPLMLLILLVQSVGL